MAGPAARVGTSDFAAVTALGVEGFAVELAATLEGTLLAEAVVGLAVLAVPSAAFEPVAMPGAGFAGELVTGLAVAFDFAAAACELGAEPDADAGAAGAGLIAEPVGGTGFVACACFGAGAAVEAA